MGHFHQLLRGLLSIAGSASCTLCCGRHTCDVAGDFTAAARRFVQIARHLIGSGILFLHRRSNRVGDIVDVMDYPADRCDRVHRSHGIRLDCFDFAADIFGCFRSFFCQLLHFVGDYCETLACFSGTSGLDGGIQRQKVCLLRNCSDDLDYLPDLGGRVTQFGHCGISLFRHLDCGGSRLSRLGSILGNFLDAATHLFGTRGNCLQIPADCLHRLCNHIGLGGCLFGVSSDLRANEIQLFARHILRGSSKGSYHRD